MFRMLPSLLAVAAVSVTLGAAPLQAQDLMAVNAMATPVLFPVAPLAPASVAVAAEARADAKVEADVPKGNPQGPTFIRASYTPRATRPPSLPMLYASQIALQALDIHSTYSAINKGAHEANPLMKGVVDNKGAMLAVKAGVTAGSILLAEKMWKKGNRTGAVATMLVMNSITAVVVANNYKVASSLR
jgi:hypothetical protein